MVAVVSGNGFGLANTSAGVLGQSGLFGNAALGSRKEGAYVNIANGSLTLQDTDDFLAAQGINIALTRTYNSLGSFNDGNGSGWKVGPAKQITGLTGTRDTAGSTVTRIGSDGSAQLYSYDTNLLVYRSTDGGGGYNYLSANQAGEWTWTSERRDLGGVVETYSSIVNGGRIASTRDQNGAQVSYQYNGAGLLSLISDENGNKVYYTYDTVNQTQVLSQIRTVPADSGLSSTTVRYGYDNINRLNKVTVDLTPGDNNIDDAKTFVTTYTYRTTTSNQIASVTQADGTKLTFGYTQVPASTGAWLLTLVTDGLSQATSYSYNTTDRITTVTDPLGYKTDYQYDAKGQLLSVTAPTVNLVRQVISYEYDANGNVTRMSDAQKQVTVYQYDNNNGNRIFERDAAGNTITRSYDPVSSVQLTETRYTVAAPDGSGTQSASAPLTTNYIYDKGNRLRFVVSPEGRVQEYRYNAAGQRITTLQYLLATTVPLAANAAARLAATEAAMAAWTQSVPVAASTVNRADYIYDLHGLVTQSRSYASLGGADRTTEPFVGQSYIYDSHGLLLQSIDGNGNVTSHTYDGMGRILTSTDALGNVTTNAYNAAGNSISTIRANGLSTNVTYDKNGYIVSVTQTDASALALGTSTYLYNKDGLLYKSTDGANLSSYFFYDAVGRKIADIDPTGLVTEYRYNLDSQLTRVIAHATLATASAMTAITATTALSTALPPSNAADRSSWNLYDAAGRLSESLDANGTVTHYDYDGVSRLVRVVQRAMPLTAAQLSALASVDVATTFGAAVSASDHVSRTLYDGDGLVLAQLDADGSLTEYRYDAAGRLRETIAYATAVAAGQRAAGDLAAMRPGSTVDDQHHYYLYNAQNRVVAAIDNAGYLTETTYDGAGNVATTRLYTAAVTNPSADTMAGLGKANGAADLLTAYTYTKLNQVLTATGTDGVTTRYTYDKAGNVTEVRRALSSVDERTTQMRYDLFGRVTAQLTPEGVALLAGAGTQAQIDVIWTSYAVKYAYNADGMRVSMTDTLGKKTLFYYDADGRPLYTIDATGAVTARSYNAFGQLTKLRASTSLMALAGLTGGVADAAVHTAVSNTQKTTDTIEAYAYDNGGRLVDDTNPLGGHTLYAYDAFGNVVQATQTSATGAAMGVTGNTYDADGRLLSTNQNGAITYYVYDTLGRLSGMVAANGTLTEYAYDADNRPVRAIQYATALASADPAGRTIDALRPVKSTDDRVSQKRYDAAGRLTDTLDAAGYLTHYDYDLGSRLVRTTQYATVSGSFTPPAASPGAPNNDRITRTFYNAAGQITARLDADGYLTRNVYNSAGQLIESIAYANPTPAERRADGELATLLPVADAAKDIRQHFLYNVGGQLIATVDGENFVTEIAYDSVGNVTKRTRHATPTTNPGATTVALLGTFSAGSDQVTNNSYSALRQVLSQTDPDGTITRYTYDKMGNVVEVRRALGAADERATQARYDALGRVTEELTPAGAAAIGISTDQNVINAAWLAHSVKYTYNSAGQRASATDQDGHKTLFYYDVSGNLRYTINAAGEVTESRYSLFNQLTSTIQVNGRLTADALAKLKDNDKLATVQDAVTAIDRKGNANLEASLVYDQLGRAIERIDALGLHTLLSYDAYGQLLTSKDVSSGVVVRYQYDHRGNLVHSTPRANEALAATTDYDAFGRAVSRTSAAGASSVGYDRLGRVTLIDDPSSTIAKISYDAFGRVLTQTDKLNAVTTYTYDTTALSFTVTTPEGVTHTTVNNHFGQTVSVADSILGGTKITTTYSYDTNGNLLRVSDNAGIRLINAYDNANLQLSTTDGKGSITSHTYDAANRVLIRTVDSATNGLKLETRYAYDAFGRTASVTDPNNNTTVTTYDANGRVIAVTIDAGDATHLNLTTRFSYDSQGNKLSVTDPNNNVTRYTYDAKGHLSSVVVDAGGLNLRTDTFYDNAGRLLLSSVGQQQSTRYAYDDQGKLAWTVDPTGAVTGYRYDANGQLIETTRYAKLSTDFTGARPAWNLTFTAQQIAASVSADPAQDAVTRTFYDNDGRVYATVDALGVATVHRKYNALNQPTEIVTYGKQVALTIAAKTADLVALLGTAAPTDRRQIVFYDTRGRVSTTLTATGLVGSTLQWSVTSFTYDACDNVISRTDYQAQISSNAPTSAAVAATYGGDRSTYMYYDGANRLVSSVSRDHEDVSINEQTDPVTGEVTETTTITDYWTVSTVAYDKNGNVVLQRSYANIMSRSGRSVPSASVVATWIAGAASTVDAQTSLVYDRANRLVATATALQTSISATQQSAWAITTQSYDANSNVIQRRSYATSLKITGNTRVPVDADIAAFIATNATAADTQALMAYDHANRLVASAALQSGSGASAQWALMTQSYDALGNRAARTWHANALTGPLAAGSFASQVVADAARDLTTTYAYDLAGRNTVVVDAGGAVTRTVYDPLGRLVQTIAYAAPHANPSRAPGPLDRVTRIVYDQHDRPRYNVDALGAVVETRYDALGNRSASIAYANPLDSSELAALDGGADATQVAALLELDTARDRVTRYAYDNAGRLRFRSDAAGYFTETRYDGQGRVSATLAYPKAKVLGEAEFAAAIATEAVVQAATARTTVYTYNNLGRVLSATDPSGAVQTYIYDAIGRQLEYSDQENKTWTYTYDAAGNRLTEKSPAVAVYSGALNTTMGAWGSGVTQAITTQYSYDTLGRLVQKTEAAGSATPRTTGYEYDAAGRLVKTSLPSIKIYDAASDALSSAGGGGAVEKDSGPRSSTVTYDIFGNAVATTDVGGATRYKVYDPMGRVVAEIDALGYVSGYTLNAFGERTTLTRYAYGLGTLSAPLTVQTLATRLYRSAADDRSISTTYDLLGRAVLVREPVVEVYDQHSLGASPQLYAGRTTASRFNAFGEVIERAVYGADYQGKAVTDSAVTRYYHDQRGLLTAQIDALSARAGAQRGYLTTYSYDLAGNVLSQVEYANAITAWDDGVLLVNGKPLHASTLVANAALDRQTSYTYDKRNLVATETHVNVTYHNNTAAGASVTGNLTTTYAYNGRGQRTRVTDALGGTTYTYYDALGRTSGVGREQTTVVSGIAAAGKRATDYKRDALGNIVLNIDYALSASVSANGSSVSTTVRNDGNNRVTATAYDIDGNAISVLNPEQYAKAAAARVVSYVSRDVYGRAVKQWQKVTTGSVAQTSYEVRTYDKLGRLTSVTTPNDRNGSATQRDTVNYGYNSFGELLTNELGDEYRYDQAGNQWLATTGGVDQVTLYDVMGNATVTIQSTSKTDLQGLASAAAALQLSEVRRTDTRYDLLGYVVDVNTAIGDAAHIMQQVNGAWIKTTAAVNQAAAGSLLVIGRPEDTGKSFSVRYRLLPGDTWIDAPASRIAWIGGHPTFNTAGLAGGDYAYQVFAQPAGEPAYQSVAGTLSVSTRDTMLAQAKDIISLYLLILSRPPSQVEIEAAQQQLAQGQTLPQLAATLFSSWGSVGIVFMYTVILGKDLSDDAVAAEALAWEAQLDAVHPASWRNGEVLCGILNANRDALDKRASALLNYLVIQGGANTDTAAQLLNDVELSEDGAIAAGTVAATLERQRDQIISLYLALFGAMPSLTDAERWSAALQSGASTLENIAQGLAETPAAGTPSELITRLYRHLLGRGATAQEMSTRLARLNGPPAMTAGAFVIGMLQEVSGYLGADSAIAAARTRLYDQMKLAQVYLSLRAAAPDAEIVSVGSSYIDSIVEHASLQQANALAYWTLYSRLASTQTTLADFGNLDDVATTERLRLSLARLYVVILGRAPELAEFNAGMTKLATADGYAQLASQLLQAQASASGALYPASLSDSQFCAQLYQAIYGRQADATALDAWSASVRDHGRAGALTRMLAALQADHTPQNDVARALLQNRAAVAITYAQCISYTDQEVGAGIIARVTGSDMTAAIAYAQGKRQGFDAIKELIDPLTKITDGFLGVGALQIQSLEPLAQAALLYTTVLNRVQIGAATTTDLSSLAATIKSQGLNFAIQQLLNTAEGKARFGTELTDGKGLALAKRLYGETVNLTPPTAPGALDYWANYLSTDVTNAFIDILNGGMLLIPTPSADIQTRGGGFAAGLSVRYIVAGYDVMYGFPQTAGTPAYNARQQLQSAAVTLSDLKEGGRIASIILHDRPETAQLLQIFQAMSILPGVTLDAAAVVAANKAINGGASLSSVITSLLLRTPGFNPQGRDLAAAQAALPREFAAALHTSLTGNSMASKIDALWAQLKASTDIGTLLIQLANPVFGAAHPDGLYTAAGTFDRVFHRLIANITTIWPSLAQQVDTKQAGDGELPQAVYDLRLMDYGLHLALTGKLGGMTELFASGTMAFQTSVMENVTALLATKEVQARLAENHSAIDFVKQIYAAFGWPATAQDIQKRAQQLEGGMSRAEATILMVNDDILAYGGTNLNYQARRLIVLEQLQAAMVEGKVQLAELPGRTELAANAADEINSLPLQGADLHLIDAGSAGLRATTTGTPQPAITVDRWGNIISVSDPRDPNWKVTYTYNYNNQLIDQTANALAGSAAQFHTQTRYDALGRVVATVDAKDNINRQGYDANGNVVTETHADGGVVTSVYDLFGQRISLTQPATALAGVIRTYAYDHLGNLLQTSTGQTANVYTAVDKGTAGLTVTVSSKVLTTSYAYDELGRRISSTDAAGVTTRQEYDLSGNVVKTIDGLNYATTSIYDDQHRLIQQIDANGNQQDWEFDADGRLIRSFDMGRAITSYEYNAAGQLVRQSSSRGQDIRYTYEGDHVTRIEDIGTGLTTDYTYDAAGNRLSEKQTYASWVLMRPERVQNNTLTYDKQNRLESVQDDQYKLTYTYDYNGNRTVMHTEYAADATHWGGDFYSYNTYDNMNRQLIVNGEKNADTSVISYGQYGHQIVYDQAGNRLSDTYIGQKITLAGSTYTVTDGLPTTESYTYDAVGRLDKVKRDALLIDTRHYDAAGRVIESGFLTTNGNQTSTANAASAIGLAANVTTSIYDANGRTLRQTTKTLGGAMSTDLQYVIDSTVGYDSVGNVRGYTLTNLSNGTSDAYAFEYDATTTYVERFVNLNNTSTTAKVHDANGQLTNVNKTNNETGESTSIRYWYDADGHVQSRKEGADTTFSLIVNGNVLGNETKEANNFLGQTYAPATSATYTSAPSVYTVQANDTLKGIAQRLWGDASLWYLIADLNGVDNGDTLAVGRALKIPARVNTVHNNYQTFRPYNASEATGNTMPLATPGNAESCGAMGNIVTAAIAVAASYVTSGKLNKQAFDYLARELGGADAVDKAMKMADRVAGGVIQPLLNQSGGNPKTMAADFLKNVFSNDASTAAVSQAFSKYGNSIASLPSAARNLMVAAANNGARIAGELQTAFDWKGIARAQAIQAERREAAYRAKILAIEEAVKLANQIATDLAAQKTAANKLAAQAALDASAAKTSADKAQEQATIDQNNANGLLQQSISATGLASSAAQVKVDADSKVAATAKTLSELNFVSEEAQSNLKLASERALQTQSELTQASGLAQLTQSELTTASDLAQKTQSDLAQASEVAGLAESVLTEVSKMAALSEQSQDELGEQDTSDPQNEYWYQHDTTLLGDDGMAALYSNKGYYGGRYYVEKSSSTVQPTGSGLGTINGDGSSTLMTINGDTITVSRSQSSGSADTSGDAMVTVKITGQRPSGSGAGGSFTFAYPNNYSPAGGQSDGTQSSNAAALLAGAKAAADLAAAALSAAKTAADDAAASAAAAKTAADNAAASAAAAITAADDAASDAADAFTAAEKAADAAATAQIAANDATDEASVADLGATNAADAAVAAGKSASTAADTATGSTTAAKEAVANAQEKADAATTANALAQSATTTADQANKNAQSVALAADETRSSLNIGGEEHTQTKTVLVDGVKTGDGIVVNSVGQKMTWVQKVVYDIKSFATTVTDAISNAVGNFSSSPGQSSGSWSLPWGSSDLSGGASNAQYISAGLETGLDAAGKVSGAALVPSNASQLDRVKAIMSAKNLDAAYDTIEVTTSKSATAISNYGLKYAGIIKALPGLGIGLTVIEESDRFNRASGFIETGNVIATGAINATLDGGATSSGSWAGAYAGALVGSAFGPLGTIIGGAAGIVIGGVVGHRAYDANIAPIIRANLIGEKFRDE
jgi:YD repeat-containing protein